MALPKKNLSTKATLPLRPNVCMLIFNKKGKLLLAERYGKKGKWQFPQGGAEPDISTRQNVYRELNEELGLKKKHLGRMIKLRAIHEYDWDKVPAYAKGIWRGQAQTFWLIEFTGGDSDINLAAHEEQELQSFQWVAPNKVQELAETKRILGYLAPLKEFKKFIRQERATKS